MAQRSKRYHALKAKIEVGNVYSLTDAVALVKETGQAKFDASIELHIKTGIDVKQSDQQVRGVARLPHGTGKKQNVLAITADAKKATAAGAYKAGGEELIKELQQGGKIDFDVLVTEPAFMAKLAPVAKILGPRGLMPSPKNGTVSTDVAKAIEELSKGKITFKNDNTGNVHVLVGKASFEAVALSENIKVAFDAIKQSRNTSVKGTFIKSATIAATMGPGIRIEIS